MSATVLIIDDEQELARDLARLLERRGYQATAAFSAAEARTLMQELCPDVVLLDLRLPDAEGGELMVELRESHPAAQFVIITAHGSIRSAVESTRQGAIEYLTKPFEPEQIALVVQNAVRSQALGEEVKRLRSRAGIRSNSGVHDPLERYRSPTMRRVLALAQKVAEQDGIVLLTGESGTGKDHLARWIHRRSRRSSGPFFDINCAALSRELADSELFGHEPGAFTGTRGRKRGLLELAEDGTLLLNEIGELDLGLQSKLLTFLDTRSFIRVGGERSIKVNARIFAATNRDLAAEVEGQRFRGDLYYRLNVLPIALPSLRDRIEDIPQLADELLDKLAVEIGVTRRPGITPEALACLARFPWQGNIRELRNILERALLANGGTTIRPSHLGSLSEGRPERATAEAPSQGSAEDTERGWRFEVSFEPGRTLHEVSRGVARRMVDEALRRTRTKQQAAALLGISRHALAHQIRQLGIET